MCALVQGFKSFNRTHACPFCGREISMNSYICDNCLSKQPQKIRNIYQITLTILKIFKVIGVIFFILWFLEFYFGIFGHVISMINMFIIGGSVLGFWIGSGIFALIFIRIILKNPNKVKENQQVQ